jgi:Tat protein translocase TatC
LNDESKMSFLEHLEELRVRLIRSAAAVFVGMFICWFFRESILSFLLQPLYVAWAQVDGLPEPKPLNFSSMLEPFIAYLKLSAIGGVFLSSPIILFQIWKFIAPGLYHRERRLALPFVVVSTLLFVGGSTMAYSLVFPIGFRFFLDFAAGSEMLVLEAKTQVVGAPGEPPEEVVSVNGAVDSGVIEDASVSRDASVASDASVTSDASMSDSGVMLSVEEEILPSGEVPAQSPDAEPWYDWLIGQVFKKECGELAATPGDDGIGSILHFQWHLARCGELPSLEKLQRDGEKIHLEWKKAPSALSGYAKMVAQDTGNIKGEHLYTLAVPIDTGTKRLAPVLMVKDYLSFAIRLLLAFGVIFELPILISFLSLAGIVNYKQLLAFSKWFLVISVVVGAILTPPDVITQMLLAAPLMILYFLSVIFAYIFGPKVD